MAHKAIGPRASESRDFRIFHDKPSILRYPHYGKWMVPWVDRLNSPQRPGGSSNGPKVSTSTSCPVLSGRRCQSESCPEKKKKQTGVLSSLDTAERTPPLQNGWTYYDISRDQYYDRWTFVYNRYTYIWYTTDYIIWYTISTATCLTRPECQCSVLASRQDPVDHVDLGYELLGS